MATQFDFWDMVFDEEHCMHWLDEYTCIAVNPVYHCGDVLGYPLSLSH
jgi:hypothetical protein